MEQRKSLRRQVSNFFHPSQSLSTVPEEGGPEQEQNEEVPQQVNMLSAPSPEKPSRLHRLSSFLPSINTKSKLSKDVLQKPVRRKQLPSRYEAPPASVAAPSSEPTNSPIAPPPNRLQKPNVRPLSEDDALRLQAPQAHLQATERVIPVVHKSETSHTRASSSPINNNAISYHSEGEGGSNAISKLRRKSWMPGGKVRSKTGSQEQRENLYSAWVNIGKHKFDYDINPLLNGEQVPELWNDAADTYVYLYPRECCWGPSFKAHSLVISSSWKLVSLLFGGSINGRAQNNCFDGGESLSDKSLEEVTRNLAIQSTVSPPYTPNTSLSGAHSMSDESAASMKPLGEAQPGEKHLYFPMHEMCICPSQPDIQSLIDVRNLFAFFTGQPLVATHRYPYQFQIFISIIEMLKKLEYSNYDGTSFGESAQASFAFYLEKQQLADVRHSREATLECLILGEAMKCADLYNEAFSHAAGKWDAIQTMKSPLFHDLSTMTRTRLDNSSRQLKNRLQAINERLTNFDFPSLFAGISSSTSSDEFKMIHFKNWRLDYENLRKAVRSYYSNLHGQWPPKAKSKKNNFSESGLNRLVLKCLYDDFSALYDYLVDRKSLTTRGNESPNNKDANPTNIALRKLLGEFDDSSPPVQPPIPFDIPLIPTMASIDPKFELLAPTEVSKANTRKLKSHEATLIMTKSHNLDTDIGITFMDVFLAFEEKESQSKNVQELAEQRIGYWIFIYAVIQSLPLLIVDAPGLHFTKGVEYFLCQPPLGASPWIEESSRGVQMSLYEVKGTGGYSLLPDDMVNHGVEATFRRSHCWQMAEMWVGPDTDTIQTQSSQPPLSPLSPPPVFGTFGGDELGLRQSSRPLSRSPMIRQRSDSGSPTPQPRSRTSSRQKRSKRQSIALGLEKIDPAYGDEIYNSSGGSRSTSRAGSPMMAPVGRRNSGIPSGGGFDSRPASATTNTGATFDDILSGIPGQDVYRGDRKGKKN